MSPEQKSAVTRPLDAAAASLMLLLCLLWGFNQVVIKLAMPDIPPVIQGAIRSTCAVLLVAAWASSRGIPLTARDRTLLPGIAAGVLFGIEFLLIYRGLLWTSASRAVLFIYTAPFFVVLGSRWFLPGDGFGIAQWLGLLLSFGGITLAFGFPAPSGNPHELLGDIMQLAAGAAWGATTLIMKASALSRAPFEKVLLYQLAVSAPLLAAGAVLFGERIVGIPSGLTLASIGYQVFVISSASYLAWFALVQRYSASRLSAFTFLTPLFGVAAGHLVLGEPVTPTFALAVLLVIAGLFLVNRPK
jgi:drug/metabolite transporter (DMT)-like permease